MFDYFRVEKFFVQPIMARPINNHSWVVLIKKILEMLKIDRFFWDYFLLNKNHKISSQVANFKLNNFLQTLWSRLKMPPTWKSTRNSNFFGFHVWLDYSISFLWCWSWNTKDDGFTQTAIKSAELQSSSLSLIFWQKWNKI